MRLRMIPWVGWAERFRMLLSGTGRVYLPHARSRCRLGTDLLDDVGGSVRMNWRRTAFTAFRLNDETLEIILGNTRTKRTTCRDGEGLTYLTESFLPLVLIQR